VAMARVLSLGIWSPEDLVDIVGTGWTNDPCQADALAVLLRAVLPASHLAALGEVWTDAVASLAANPGELALADAVHLIHLWCRQAASRSEEWRRPRRQRRRHRRRSEHPAGDLAGCVR
jgi:hypothetical protein